MKTDSSITKALQLLDLFTPENPVIGLNEIARLSGYPKATVYRMISTLEACGFISRSQEHAEDRRYKLGIKLFELGMKVYNEIEINKVSLPIMKEIRDAVGECVQLSVAERTSAIYIEKVDTEHMFRLFTAKGRRSPLYAGASGIVLLSFMDDEKIEAIISGPLERFSENTPINKDAVLERIAFVRSNGYSVSREELCDNSMEIAVPIYEYQGNVAAALSIAGPITRMENSSEAFYVEILKKYAAVISHELGFNPKANKNTSQHNG